MALVKDGEGRTRLAHNLTLGSEVSCTTVRGDTFRGNLMAVDESAMLLVISILSQTYLLRNSNHNSSLLP